MKFGPLVSRLVAWVQMRGVERATTAEVCTALRLSADQGRQLLTRLGRSGLAIQLQRGLYLFPQKLPPGGRWTPSPTVVLKHLFEAKGGSYQETGPGAFQFHGLTEQVANITTVYNTQFSGRSRIGGLAFMWIEVAEPRLGGLDGKALPDRRIGSLARVVMDAVYDSARFGTLPAAFRWITQRREVPGVLDELAECAIAHGNAATCRRLGGVFELLGVAAGAQKRLRAAIPDFQTHIPIVPGRNRVGRTMKGWGLIINDRGWMDA